MRHLVNRTAIHVLSQNHRIRDKMLHPCTSRGATCTAKQGRIVQTQNIIFGRFSNFFFIQMGPGPTHPLPNYFWNFFNFAKPLRLVPMLVKYLLNWFTILFLSVYSNFHPMLYIYRLYSFFCFWILRLH